MLLNDIQAIRQLPEILQIQKKLQNRSSLEIEICITNACNKSCSYCFERCHQSNINIDEETRQLQLITDLCQKFDIMKYSSLNIVFWGGEPMMNINFIKKIINNTKQYTFINYFMYTNGTILSAFLTLVMLPDFELIKNRFTIQISYDGEPHNTIKRGYSYTDISRTLQLLYENNINVKFKATLSYDMIINLPEIWKSYAELDRNFPLFNVQYAPTLDTNVFDIPIKYLNDWKQSLIQIVRYELDRLKTGKKYLMSWFYCIDEKKFCGINERIMLNDDGKIYICHGCPYAKNSNDFIIGYTNKIKSLFDIMLFNHNVDQLKDSCKKCGAEICTNCHITMCNSKMWEKTWTTFFDSNHCRCNFFKMFGIIKHAMNLAILTKDN